jgi:hypothetical protein
MSLRHDLRYMSNKLPSKRAQARAQAIPDPIIEKAKAATQKVRLSMIRKYTKKHDIQHFEVGAIVSIKVPREDRTCKVLR